MRKAFTFKPGGKRNREFKNAEDQFRKALKEYMPEYRKNKTRELELKIIRVQEQLYNCLKNRTH